MVHDGGGNPVPSKGQEPLVDQFPCVGVVFLHPGSKRRKIVEEQHFYAVVLARPAKGLRRLYALWRWFFEPKWKRVKVEIRNFMR